jgi:carbon starvation protein
MGLLAVVLVSAAVLVVAYRMYGSVLARLFKLDPDTPTPAVQMRDDVDYVPIEPKFLVSQHFSAIAAAGPIVGPILAGLMFGWLPALIWILVGSIFIGGVHDIGTLVASIRHRARSIADVVRQHMSKRSYILFLLFIWIALVYIIVAFTDVVAGSFVGVQDLTREAVDTGVAAAESTDRIIVSGGGVATSSLLYLALPIIMGLLLRYIRLSLGWATAIFLPLVGVAIWLGPKIPFDLQQLLHLQAGPEGAAAAQRIWGVLLLLYCFVASVLPMWLLLQPRGHLGGYFLFAALASGMIGILLGPFTSGVELNYPAFRGFAFHPAVGSSQPLFPILFITIACGACSGFHSIIASGTTSKQLKRETDAKVVGYGSMLLEAMVAVVSLCCVMLLTQEKGATLLTKPGFVYAQGMGRFLEVLYIPASFGIMFGLLAFTTFVYDTLDVCTRLGRYIIQELTGWQGNGGKWFATAATAGVPLIFLAQKLTDAKGNPIPAWKVFWNLFGASNQLLAALSLLGVTVWLWRTYKAKWVWLVAGVPTVVMYVMSTWALLIFVREGFFDASWSYRTPHSAVPWAAAVLVALALLVLIEAIRCIRGPGDPGALREALPAGV